MTALAALLLLAQAPAAALPASPGLAADAAVRWVPFTLTPAGQIRFALRIDGRPATAILDTGVTVSTVSRAFAARTRFAVTDGPGAVTIGGRIATQASAGHAIAFGALAQTGIRFAVADIPAAATGGGAVDVLIGADLTAPFALDIDYAAQRFRLLPSGRLPFHGRAARLRIGADWPFYVTDLTIGGARFDRIVVDTGDGTALTLSRTAAGYLGALPATTTTLDQTLGGPVLVERTILPAARSDAAMLRDIELRIEPAQGFAAATGMSGRIGAGVLRRYRVLLDPRAGRMVLAGGGEAAGP